MQCILVVITLRSLLGSIASYHKKLPLQEELGLQDRVRLSGQFATSPCMIKIAAPTNSTPPGCGREFVSPDNFDYEEPTPVSQFDAEITFSASGTYDTKRKQIPFTCESALCRHSTKLSMQP